MKLLGQIGIVFGICLLGELIAAILPFTFPSSIISMSLLFILLMTKLLKIEHIERKADFLLQNMAFFFVPAGVGILEHTQLLKGFWWQFLLICAVTLLLVFASTVWTVSGVLAIQRKLAERSRKKKMEGGDE